MKTEANKHEKQAKYFFESGMIGFILKGFIDYAFDDAKYKTKFQMRIDAKRFERDCLESFDDKI
jgi:hypothetical protein